MLYIINVFCWKYSIVKQKGGDANVLVALDAIKYIDIGGKLMRNIRRSVALALAAIMMMAMNMVSFAADTAPAETEAVESVTRSTNGESVLLDKVYFACDGKTQFLLENLFLLQL